MYITASITRTRIDYPNPDDENEVTFRVQVDLPGDPGLWRRIVTTEDTVTGEYKGLPGFPYTIADDSNYSLTMKYKKFVKQFTAVEFRNIEKSMKIDDTTIYLWETVKSEPNVDLSDPDVIELMAQLVTNGDISQPRHDEIMKGDKV